MVECVPLQGWSVTASADRFLVDPRTVRRWRDRFLAEDPPGLDDRPRRTESSPDEVAGNPTASEISDNTP